MSLTHAQRIFGMVFTLIVGLPPAFTAHSAPGAKARLLLTSITVENISTSGFDDFLDVGINEYDKHGTLFLTRDTNYISGSVQLIVGTRSYDYDNKGNLIRSVYLVGFDGMVDERVTDIYTNLPNGQSQAIESYDDNLDGNPDSIYTFTYTYDNNDRIVKTVLDGDFNADGRADYRTTQTRTYDLTNHQIVTITTYEPYAEGIANDAFPSVETDVTDDRGYPTSGVIQYANGSETRLTWTYNKFGNMTQQIVESEDGVTTFTYTWDPRGQAIRSAPHPHSREFLQATSTPR